MQKHSLFHLWTCLKISLKSQGVGTLMAWDLYNEHFYLSLVEYQCIQKWHPLVTSGFRGQALTEALWQSLTKQVRSKIPSSLSRSALLGLEGVQYHAELKTLYLSRIKLDEMLFYYRDLLDVVSCSHTSLEIPEQRGCAWGSMSMVQAVLVLCYRSSL